MPLHDRHLRVGQSLSSRTARRKAHLRERGATQQSGRVGQRLGNLEMVEPLAFDQARPAAGRMCEFMRLPPKLVAVELRARNDQIATDPPNMTLRAQRMFGRVIEAD